MKRPTSSPALIAGLGALGAVVYLVGGRVAQAVLLVGFAAAASAALALGVRRHRPQHVLPWLLLAACQGCWAVGWAVWQLHVLRHGGAPAPGSSVDAVFLVGNAAQVAALAFLVRLRGRSSGALLDTSILAVAIGVIAWAVLIGPYAGSDGLPTAARLTQILYAAGDVAVLALTLRLALWRPARQPALELVALAMAACLVADVRWNWLTLAGGYQAGSWTDVGWLLYAALVAAAGLHPSIARGAGTEGSRPSLSRLGAALLGVAAVTPLAVIGGELWRSGRASWAVVGAGGVLCGLVVLRLLGVVRRVEQLSARVRAADARFRNLVEQLPLVTYIDAVDDSASNLYTSPQTETLLGYSPTEWADDPHMFERLLHPDDRAWVLALVEHCNRTGERFLAEFRLIARDGRVVWVRDESVIIYDEHGDALHAQGYMFDITARRRAEDELAHRAYHDPLTGLPNRMLFEQRLDEAIAGSGEDAGVAVLYADLDEFKLVNDSFGHAAGDALLQQVAERLGRAAGGGVVARQGGDEFLILVRAPLARLAAAASGVAEAARDALQRPFPLAGLEVYASASVGISLFPLDADSAEALLKHADVAMYDAKRGGRDGWCAYGERDDDALSQLELVSRLRGAVERGELALQFQPIVRLRDGAIVGAEALVRWRLDGALVPPDAFIPLAERTGLIRPITSWVIDAAGAAAAAWRARGVELPISVNISPVSIGDELIAQLVGAVDRHGLEPDLLRLEVTETAAMADAEETRRVLDALASRGFVIAIDDFGTGHSSLSRLAGLPVRTIKIDRSFTRALDDGEEGPAAALVSSIVQLALTLGREPLAEGIETEAQRRLLLARGCGLGQGFLFSRPVDGDAFLRLVAEDGRAAA